MKAAIRSFRNVAEELPSRSRPLGSVSPVDQLLPLRVLDLHDFRFFAVRLLPRHVQSEFAGPVALGSRDHPLCDLGAILRADTIALIGQSLGLGVVGPLQD